MAGYIVIVEDDHLQEGPIRELLEESFPGAEIEIITTEYDFRERLPSFRQRRPDILIVDVMLRWADPQPNFPKPPAEVQQEGYYRAGLRCAELVSLDESLQSTPVVLFTILQQQDLERQQDDNEYHKLGRNVKYMRKGEDTGQLIRLARSLVPSS